ncbi:MAG: hypothetical protein KC506_01865 [Nanoarchaeota archaeon]|nr:hypothetical protein [Nanoarchaeota archaeon]
MGRDGNPIMGLLALGAISYVIVSDCYRSHQRNVINDEIPKMEVTADLNSNGLNETYLDVNDKRYFSQIDGKSIDYLLQEE